MGTSMSGTSRLCRLLFAVAVLVLLAGLVCAAALATAPGKNGRIAFRRYFDPGQTKGAIFTINADGSDERRVTHPPLGSVDDQPDWSPDGSLLVFARCATDFGCAIYTVRPDGGALKRLSPPCPAGAQNCEDDNNVAFTPDGKHVSFTRAWGGVKDVLGGDQIKHSDIVVMDLAGHDRRTLLASAAYRADLNFAAFAPDGKRFVYEHSNSPLATPPGRRALFVATSAGKGDHRITPWSLNAGDNPDWSPDGNWIVFRSHVDDDGSSNIFVVRPDGSGLRQLTHLKQGANLRSACFSPDGQSIVFATDGQGGNPDVYVMLADGTGMHPITRSTLWDSAADWGTAH